jgi:hypothetical protein
MIQNGAIAKSNLMTKPRPNFRKLDSQRPGIAVIIAAMLQARQAVERRSCAFPQEPTDDCWWADVLSDPRTRNRPHRHSGNPAAQRAYYTLADEPRPTISVACTKCEWKADFSRVELISMYGLIRYRTCSIILLRLPARNVGSQWDRCGAYWCVPLWYRRSHRRR